MMSEADLFARAGQDYERAHELLMSSCDYPPSFEGFLHLLLEERERSSVAVTPSEMARRIVQTYRPCR